jgi:hypothetical protein
MMAPKPVPWRAEKTVFLSGHSLHRQTPSPVSQDFVAPAISKQIHFRPEALAASMARTLTLRDAPDFLLTQWARAQLVEIESMVAEGASFELSPLITVLADAERSGFAGRVGAGVADLLMNALGYAWRDNATCLSGALDPRADFIYAGGAVTGHGVVLAEAHGSFAQSVSESRIRGEARRKYLRQVKPHIDSTCVHGKVIHGYSVAFGSNPTSLDTYLHLAETKITKKKAPPSPAGQPAPAGPDSVVTSLALAAHRSNFFLMGASQVVAWIDWLRGEGERPDEEATTTFLAVEIASQRFLVAAEHFFPYVRTRVLLDALDWLRLPWHWQEFERVRQQIRSDPQNVFAMDEWAAKSFLNALSGLIGGGRDQMRPVIELPVLEPSGFFISEPVRSHLDYADRYPVAQFRDGLALLGRLPRRPTPDDRFWSPRRGLA